MNQLTASSIDLLIGRIGAADTDELEGWLTKSADADKARLDRAVLAELMRRQRTRCVDAVKRAIRKATGCRYCSHAALSVAAIEGLK